MQGLSQIAPFLVITNNRKDCIMILSTIWPLEAYEFDSVEDRETGRGPTKIP